MVGFQTKLKRAEQVRVLRTIPGLANAEFARLGGLHRNTFLNAPRLLDGELRLKAAPRLRFAGQGVCLRMPRQWVPARSKARLAARP